MSVYQRQLLRPSLNSEHTYLCVPSAEMSPSWQFGDNLAKTQQDLVATRRLIRFTRGSTSGSFLNCGVEVLLEEVSLGEVSWVTTEGDSRHLRAGVF